MKNIFQNKVQFNIRIPMECRRDFKKALIDNGHLGHKLPGVFEDLLNYYTDYGLPQPPEALNE